MFSLWYATRSDTEVLCKKILEKVSEYCDKLRLVLQYQCFTITVFHLHFVSFKPYWSLTYAEFVFRVVIFT